MGYWSSHPLGGDEPMDAYEKVKNKFMLKIYSAYAKINYSENILDKIFELYDKYLNMEYEQQEHEFGKSLNYMIKYSEINDFKKRIKCIINNPDLSYYKKDLNYIIPFTVLNHLEGYTLNNKSKSNLNYIKEMLRYTDGGSERRGYNKSENTYPNSISTPEDYVKAIYDNWDKIVAGEYNYKLNLLDKGLFYEAIKSRKTGYNGLINTR